MAYAEEEKKAIEDLLQKGVIQKSTSPWASPIVLVKKTSGAIRPCIDYRKLNATVKPDGFPIPRVQDCLDAVAGSTLFSSFDLTSRYFQIPLKPEDIPKTAFCCKYGHFEMTRMPFGLNNAGSTFQRTMELALQGLQWETCLVYIDDIIVFGTDFIQHIQRVEEVLERLRAAGLKLRPDKCNMLQTEVVFLGHIVSQSGISPDPANIMKIAEWPRPVNAKQAKQFVATGSYYRRFVRDYAKIARPLIDLTKKDSSFVWSQDCEDAFDAIKKALMGPEIMGYPMNSAGSFCLDTDASGTGIGGVLSQMQSGRERVIAYASRGMNKAEKNYCITEQELLAVVYFVQHFRQYLVARKFLVRSDHQALVWLFSLKEPSGKIARWIEILAPYDFTIEYRPGKKMGYCDALSRCPTPRDCTCSDIDMSEPLKCGPCAKCTRRAEAMALQLEHSFVNSEIETNGAIQEGVDSYIVPEPGGKPEQARAATEASPDEPVQGPSKPMQRETTGWMWVDTPRNIAAKQLRDPDIGPIIKAKIEDHKPNRIDMETESQASRHYWILWDILYLKDGVLCKTFEKHNGTGEFVQWRCERRSFIICMMPYCLAILV